MAARPISRFVGRRPALGNQHDPILPFLAPSLQPTLLTARTSASPFSTSRCLAYPRDNNRSRGLSALRSSGLRRRQTLSILKEPIPKPVLDSEKRARVDVNPDHGLWQFFNKEKNLLSTPEEDASCGRPWTVEELRGKSWEDLHALWWVCAKERNRLATESIERKRVKAGYGDYEARARDFKVKITQRNIKWALTERWYAWEAARTEAKYDSEVDLSGKGPAYVPGIQSDPLEAEEPTDTVISGNASGINQEIVEIPNRSKSISEQGAGKSDSTISATV